MASEDCVNVDDVLVVELAAGKTVVEAATVAGVTERTVYRRLQERGFVVRVAECRAAMIGASAGRLVAGMPEATATLRSLLKHSDPNVQHRAAVKLIELAMKVTETAELERRVAALEGMAPSASPITHN